MRVALSWLAEHVDLPAGTSVEDVDAALVRMGLEVEAVEALGARTRGPLVVGLVEDVEELTGFKRPIRFCRVRVAPAGAQPSDVEGEPVRGIVCGATNMAPGDLVVVALPGSVLPGGVEISARSTYGRVSDGMICSLRELGLGDEHTGILVLPPTGLPAGRTADTAPGLDARALLGLDDTVFELAVTPDRGYCLSVRGVARELATGLRAAYRDPALDVEPLPAAAPPGTLPGSAALPYDVRVADTVGCDRFVAGAVHGVDPAAPTPLWMRRRLLSSGVRSISLAVDVTNYVMLELGQPMHAFDVDRLDGPVVVRRAQAGERLTTLDGLDRSLDPEDLLITDGSGPIGLAAVMGGASTEVSATTSDVLLEAAHWDPVTVARTARRHRLPSEASKRFERGVDPEMTTVAVARAAGLLAAYGGGTVHPGVLDLDARVPAGPVLLDSRLPGRVAGVDYPPAAVTGALETVGCTVRAGAGVLEVLPPSWRPDLRDPADLVEEVVRVEGYDAVPSVPPPVPVGSGLTPRQRLRRSVGLALAEAGLVEVQSYPFVAPEVHDTFRLEPEDPRRVALRVANPLSDAEPELRTSLLPGLLKTLRRNLGRGARDVALYETGLVVLPAGTDAPLRPPVLGVDRAPTDAELEALLSTVPSQPWHVAAVLTGERDPSGWWGPGRAADWSDAVAVARTVAAVARVAVTVRAAARPPWHPGRCAEIALVDGGAVVGWAGELHPGVLADLELPPRTCAVELELDALPLPGLVAAPAVSTFPPALLDVALLVPAATPAAEVEAALRAGAGALLEGLRLFDVYTGPALGDGVRSLAYALTFRAPDRTLTVGEAVQARDAAVGEAARRVGAVLRGA